MPARISFRLEARDGAAVPFDAFAEMTRRIASVLSELDVLDPDAKSVRWLIRDLRLGSAVVALEALPVNPLVDTSPQIVRQFSAGMSVIVFQQVRPAWFSDRAWEDARAVVDVLHDGIARLAIDTGGVELEMTSDVRLAPPEEDDLTAEAAAEQEAITSIEGRIENVYGHDRSRLRFALWDAVHNARVACEFSAALEDDVRRGLFERVRVRGLARFDASGRPTHVRVEAITVLDRRAHRPTIREMRGLVPNLTGGLPSEVWVRQIRDA